MKKYQVIGGQYVFCNYGESDSLLGAKQIAGRHPEYWDNWQGWHKPDIYLSEDCVDGQATEFNYRGIAPKYGAQPVSIFINGNRDYTKGAWLDRIGAID